jgi:MoaA/NifB/PqqE/SkfB family radical SAM enzyme
MDLREGLAWRLAKTLNRRALVRDTPRSEAFYAVRYGTARKFHNYLMAKSEYRGFKEKLTSFPYTLRIDPVSACNLQCPLCPTGAGQFERPVTMMSEAAYGALLEELRDFIFYVRMYLWGDPLLNKNLWRLIAMTERCGIGSEISTNLSIPLTDSTIDHLIEAGLSWLIVSIDGATSETYQTYRRGGDFDLVIKNSRRILERKRTLRSQTPYLEWQFIPMRHNEHEMGDIVRLGSDCGVDGVRFKPARLDKVTEVSSTTSETDSFVAKWKPIHAASHYGPSSYLDAHCNHLWGHATVHSDGAIGPCCEAHRREHDVGHIASGSFREQWSGPAFRRLRRIALGRNLQPGDETAPCLNCQVFKKPFAGEDALRCPGAKIDQRNGYLSTVAEGQQS